MITDTPAPSLLRVLARIRVRDAIIFEAPTVIAAVLYSPNGSALLAVRTALLVLGGFLLMAHIFAFNDWTDMTLDHQNVEKHNGSLVERGIASRQILYLAVFLAVGGLLAVALVSPALLPIAAMTILLGVVYSFPSRGLKAKGIPVLSSILHFSGTVLTFLLGSAAFQPIDTGALLLGCYFGVLITAGHLVQEVQDYADDRRAGIHTNAVQFGQAPMFFLSFALFGLSFVFLVILAWANLIPVTGAYSGVLFLIYAYWAIRVYRDGLRSSRVRQLRNRYRILFGVVAMILLVSALAEKFL